MQQWELSRHRWGASEWGIVMVGDPLPGTTPPPSTREISAPAAPPSASLHATELPCFLTSESLCGSGHRKLHQISAWTSGRLVHYAMFYSQATDQFPFSSEGTTIVMFYRPLQYVNCKKANNIEIYFQPLVQNVASRLQNNLFNAYDSGPITYYQQWLSKCHGKVLEHPRYLLHWLSGLDQ